MHGIGAEYDTAVSPIHQDKKLTSIFASTKRNRHHLHPAILSVSQVNRIYYGPLRYCARRPFRFMMALYRKH